MWSSSGVPMYKLVTWRKPHWSKHCKIWSVACSDYSSLL